ncbi:DUF305 domain-containing protein [Nonomuraea sp. NPDC005983]|uniref:DUF305 domain-containing protein n=1 Tax=Nonomuraea sp. NPDC005983 TaxID=3155595 RepID=UPI0033A9F8FA
MGTSRTFSIAAAAGCLTLLAACGGNGATMASADRPTAIFNAADVTFAQMMVPHHEQAVEMGDLASTRASSPDVKTIADKINAAQEAEIQTMKDWLSQWGKSAPADSMGHDMPGGMSRQDMDRLQAANGKAFDKRYVQLMIVHHEGAIKMARTEQADGANPAAKKLARKIASSQQAEVAELQKILAHL